MNNKEALQLYQEYSKHLPNNAPKSEKADAAASKLIAERFPSFNHKSMKIKFVRLADQKPTSKTTQVTIAKWEQSPFVTTVEPPTSTLPPPPDDEKPKKGRPSLTLGDKPCLKVERNTLKVMVQAVEKFATEQNITKEEALQKTVDACYRTWNTTVSRPAKSSMPVFDATAMMFNVNLSTQQYQMIRTLCLEHGIVLPPRNDVDNCKKKYHPEITSTQLKSSVEPTALLDETVSALVRLNKNGNHDDAGRKVYRMVGKFGADGSGSHKIRQQLVDEVLAMTETGHLDPKKCNSFLLSCYVPLELYRNDQLVWTNPIPNSTSFARPLSLTRAPEDREVLSVELEPCFSSLIRQEYETCLTVDQVPIDVVCKTECSMLDGKMVSYLLGDSGAYCHLCDVTRSDANDVEMIANGFNITKDYESTKKAWDQLASGEIAYTSKERKGQCHENLVKADLHCFSILHFKLRSLDFAQKILYRLQCGQKDWREEGVTLAVMGILKRAKKECIEALRETTTMLIDTPTHGGGNTNNGPLADSFFSAENRRKISSLINNTEDRENFETFMSLTNVMLTVTQSITDKRVRIQALKDLGIELMLHLKNSFLDHLGRPWIMIIPSFHQMCAHSWEMFQWNNGQSIGKWSESPLESWNKHVRAFQSGPSSRARQFSIKDNIHDIFCRMLITSHPEIASKRPRVSCNICGEVGHTARSSRHKRSTVATEEQAHVQSMYY